MIPDMMRYDFNTFIMPCNAIIVTLIILIKCYIFRKNSLDALQHDKQPISDVTRNLQIL